MNISYFDKIDYMAEKTLNVIDQILFIEHYKELSEYISENYIELKSDDFYLEKIDEAKFGTDRVNNNKLDGVKFTKSPLQWIKKAFLTLVGYGLKFFEMIVNFFIRIINSAGDKWNQIKNNWGKKNVNEKDATNENLVDNPEIKNAVDEAETSVEKADQLLKEETNKSTNTNDQQTIVKNSVHYDFTNNYSYYREDDQQDEDDQKNIVMPNRATVKFNENIFTKFFGAAKKADIIINKDDVYLPEIIQMMLYNNFIINQALGNISLKAYTNAVINLSNPAIGNYISLQRDIPLTLSKYFGQSGKVSYLNIINFFKENTDRSIWSEYNEYYKAFSYTKMLKYINAINLKNNSMPSTEYHEAIDSYEKGPEYVNKIRQRCINFKAFLSDYLDYVNKQLSNPLKADYKAKAFVNKYSDTDETIKDFEKPDKFSNVNQATDATRPKAVYGISVAYDNDDENHSGLKAQREFISYTDDINSLRYVTNKADFTKITSSIEARIKIMGQEKKDIETLMNENMAAHKKTANTSAAKIISEFFKKTIKNLKETNKALKIQTAMIEAYNRTGKALNLIEKIKLNFNTNK